jgi:uncharacterized protein YcnI
VANGVQGTLTATATAPLTPCEAPTLLHPDVARLVPHGCELKSSGSRLSYVYGVVFTGPEPDGGNFYDF